MFITQKNASDENRRPVLTSETTKRKKFIYIRKQLALVLRNPVKFTKKFKKDHPVPDGKFSRAELSEDWIILLLFAVLFDKPLATE